MQNDEVSVRYMVDDVDEAVAFYTKFLDFEPLMNAAPAFRPFSVASMPRSSKRRDITGTA